MTSTVPVSAAAINASMRRSLAWSRCPVSRCASASSHSAVPRHGLHSGSRATEKAAPAIICSGPLAHQSAAPLVERHDDAGFGPAKLPEQELPEQIVVAVPLPPTVEWDQEQTGGLQAAQVL